MYNTQSSDAILYDHLKNKLVIALSNEVQDLTVGELIGFELITQAKQPIPLVKNIITGEIVMPFGIIFEYTEQKFNALNKLDPNERIAIFYSKIGNHTVEKTPIEPLHDPLIWKEKVLHAVRSWEGEQYIKILNSPS